MTVNDSFSVHNSHSPKTPIYACIFFIEIIEIIEIIAHSRNPQKRISIISIISIKFGHTFNHKVTWFDASPFFRPCKSLPNPIFLLFYGTDLKRRWNGLITESLYSGKKECFLDLKNRIFILLCNSSPSTLQVVVTLMVTAVIHFKALVTHSPPKSLYLTDNVSITKKIHSSPLINDFRVTSELTLQIILYQ